MNTTRQGLLIVISGPSGVGKGTVTKEFLSRNTNAELSVSATTRARRPQEIEGVNYFFKTQEEFKRMIDNDEFLEYMQVFGMNFYGTPRAFVEEKLAQGRDIVLEIDVNGAMKVKKAYPEAVTIFIAPPTMSDIKSRLYGRGTENDSAIDRRYREAFEEMQYIRKYDYVVVNDIIDRAVKAVCSIAEAEKSKVSRNNDLIQYYDEELKSND